MANEAVNQVIADYYRDFSTLNVQAILPYFNEPSLLVGPQGVIPIPDRAALVAVFGSVMEGLRAKGYGRSELELGYVKSLSPSRPPSTVTVTIIIAMAITMTTIITTITATTRTTTTRHHTVFLIQREQERFVPPILRIGNFRRVRNGGFGNLRGSAIRKHHFCCVYYNF